MRGSNSLSNYERGIYSDRDAMTPQQDLGNQLYGYRPRPHPQEFADNPPDARSAGFYPPARGRGPRGGEVAHDQTLTDERSGAGSDRAPRMAPSAELTARVNAQQPRDQDGTPIPATAQIARRNRRENDADPSAELMERVSAQRATNDDGDPISATEQLSQSNRPQDQADDPSVELHQRIRESEPRDEDGNPVSATRRVAMEVNPPGEPPPTVAIAEEIHGAEGEKPEDFREKGPKGRNAGGRFNSRRNRGPDGGEISQDQTLTDERGAAGSARRPRAAGSSQLAQRASAIGAEGYGRDVPARDIFADDGPPPSSVDLGNQLYGYRPRPHPQEFADNPPDARSAGFYPPARRRGPRGGEVAHDQTLTDERSGAGSDRAPRMAPSAELTARVNAQQPRDQDGTPIPATAQIARRNRRENDADPSAELMERVSAQRATNDDGDPISATEQLSQANRPQDQADDPSVELHQRIRESEPRDEDGNPVSATRRVAMEVNPPGEPPPTVAIAEEIHGAEGEKPEDFREKGPKGRNAGGRFNSRRNRGPDGGEIAQDQTLTDAPVRTREVGSRPVDAFVGGAPTARIAAEVNRDRPTDEYGNPLPPTAEIAQRVNAQREVGAGGRPLSPTEQAARDIAETDLEPIQGPTARIAAEVNRDRPTDEYGNPLPPTAEIAQRVNAQREVGAGGRPLSPTEQAARDIAETDLEPIQGPTARIAAEVNRDRPVDDQGNPLPPTAEIAQRVRSRQEVGAGGRPLSPTEQAARDIAETELDPIPGPPPASPPRSTGTGRWTPRATPCRPPWRLPRGWRPGRNWGRTAGRFPPPSGWPGTSPRIPRTPSPAPPPPSTSSWRRSSRPANTAPRR